MTIGAIVATRIALPLVTPFVLTTAVRTPAEGRVESSTVKLVDVDAITVPTAPLFRVTVLFAAVVSKPDPVMLIDVGFCGMTLLLSVTVGVTVET